MRLALKLKISWCGLWDVDVGSGKREAGLLGVGWVSTTRRGQVRVTAPQPLGEVPIDSNHVTLLRLGHFKANVHSTW